MVDQTTRGHQFLKKNFGISPRGTWQIDPFGHSDTEAWLLGAEAGMESLFWGRTDYQDFALRKNQSRLEWVWQGSQSLGASAQLFAGALYGGGGGGYGTWIGFDGSNPEVQDDPSRHDYNIDRYVDQFVQHAQSQAAHTRTEHQLWACGSDFQYQNADHWYHNLDKLIHYVNQNGTVNAFYSTPTRYVAEKKKAGLQWEVRTSDIWPLADNAHNYWTGYFTSRPALKRQVRFASSFLQAARQMEVASGVTAADVDTPTTRPSPPVGDSWTDSLEGTIGVATHHDGMSGTERQDVSDDYEVRISESHAEVEAGVSKSLAKLMGLGDTAFGHCNCNAVGAANCLNISVCAHTTGVDNFAVVAWNPQGLNQKHLFRIPVTAAQWSVADADGNAVPAQTQPLTARTLGLPKLYLNRFNMTAGEVAAAEAALANKATHMLMFSASVPAIGYATFTAKASGATAAAGAAAAVSPRVVPQNAAPFSVSNGNYNATFDPATGKMSSLMNIKSGLSAKLSIDWGWYNSSVGGCTDLDGIKNAEKPCSGQKSGAYIFRPNSSQVFYPGPTQVPTLRVVEGPLVTEVYQTFSDWATHVVRLWKDAPYVEVEWTAGPIPIHTPWLPAASGCKEKWNHDDGDRCDRWGKEVIMRYSSDLATDGTYYADANGREMVQRKYNLRPEGYPDPYKISEPVAGNYYPVNSMIAVQDEAKGAQLAVITDVSQGGASLAEGQIELMVHRRLQQDDSRGVQEPLNETMCGCNDIHANPGAMGQHGHEGDGGCVCDGLTMRGRHWLVLDTVENANSVRRQAIEDLNFAPTLAFAPAAAVAGAKRASWSAISKLLPENVKLMTLTNNYQAISDGAVFLRLAHLYSVGEHPTLSQPATVSLKALFAEAGLTITSAEAWSLTGNTPQAKLDAQYYDWKEGKVTGNPGRVKFDPNDPTLSVTLRPMELRTFFVKFS